MTENSGWIYIPNWDDLQHYSDRRPTWIKLYLDLLDNDDFNELTFAQRGVLIQIWILSARVGNGRLAASTSTLRRYLQPTSKADSAHLPRTLERLSEAGFLEVRASKALAVRYQRASPEKRRERGEEKPLKVSPSPIASSNGKPATADAAGSPTKVKKPHRPLEPGQHRDAGGFLC